MRLKKRYIPLLSLLILGAVFLAGCGSSGGSQDSNKSDSQPQSAANNSVAAGATFKEYPVGEEKEVEGMKIGGVYYQPVLMAPAEKAGLTPEQSDIHLEADVAALEGNKTGFGAGEFIPDLTVRYQAKNLDNGQTAEGTFMPMNATDGAHYGANVKLPGAGKYKLTYVIESPEKKDYLLHVDKETGVEGRFWNKPIEVSWEFPWVPRKW